jgi:hypothetical protein
MKVTYLLAPLGAAALLISGCAYHATPAVSYVAPPVTTAYVAPPNTVVLGAGPAVIDSDGDGYANSVDRYPYDPRWH